MFFSKNTYVGKEFKVPLNPYSTYLIIRPSSKGLLFKVHLRSLQGSTGYFRKMLSGNVEVTESDGGSSITSKTLGPYDLIRAVQDAAKIKVRNDLVEAVEVKVREILGSLFRYKAQTLQWALAYRSLGCAEDHDDVRWLMGYVDKIRYADGLWGGPVFLSGSIVDHCLASMSFMSGLTRERQDAAITYLFEMLDDPPSRWVPSTWDMEDLF